MKIELGHVHLDRISAGLAIHDEAIYYVELDEDSNPTKKIKIPLAENCVVNGRVKNNSLLENAFEELHEQIGKPREPIGVGLPAGEVIIKFLNFPKMTIDDIRGTMDLNFEEHFNFPRNEAVFDVIEIKTPADLVERDEITVLAAAARRVTVEQILDAMWKAGLPAGGVEPLNFAMLHSIPEAQEGLCIFADLNSIIAIWEGVGIYFRSANNANGMQDILNTIQFLKSQYRHAKVERIITYRLDFQINTNQNSGIDFVNVLDEFYSAEGVALRNVQGVQSLDMRPMEFIELEKRRYRFNINRLILWVLMLGFIMFSVGTIAFTFSCMQSLSYEIEIMRESADDLTRQRMELAAENSRLEKQKEKIERVLDFIKSDIPVLEVMEELEMNTEEGIKFDHADFIRGNMGGITVNLDGKAEDEKLVLSMTEGLKDSKLFSSVSLPVSQKDMTGRVVFKLILTVRNENG